MGSKICAQTYFKEVHEANNLIARGPPLFIQTTKSQKQIAERLTVHLKGTCKACECLKSFANIIIPKNVHVDMALPNDDTLRFDKKDVLAESVRQIEDISIFMKSGGYTSINTMGYLGRLLFVIQKTIDEDLQSGDDVLSCKESANQSLEMLEKFYSELPEEYKERKSAVFVLNDTEYTNKWDNVYIDPYKE
jgi:hypothetical protein